MARVESAVRCPCALLVVLAVAVLLIPPPVVAARSVPSGWDVSLSTGSSDSTLWRKFTTLGQAAGYQRLLLGLETSRATDDTDEVSEVEANRFANKIAATDFNTMDYARPGTNRPGSSDQITPPTP